MPTPSTAGITLDRFGAGEKREASTPSRAAGAGGMNATRVLGLQQAQATEAQNRGLEQALGSRAEDLRRVCERLLQLRGRIGDKALDQGRIVESDGVFARKRGDRRD